MIQQLLIIRHSRTMEVVKQGSAPRVTGVEGGKCWRLARSGLAPRASPAGAVACARCARRSASALRQGVQPARRRAGARQYRCWRRRSISSECVAVVVVVVCEGRFMLLVQVRAAPVLRLLGLAGSFFEERQAVVVVVGASVEELGPGWLGAAATPRFALVV